MMSSQATAISFLIAVLCVIPLAQAEQKDVAPWANDACGGVIVHLGCGEAVVTAPEIANKAFVVHGLDTDPEKVRQTQAAFQEHINASAAVFDGKTLPYIDGMVNVLVVHAPFDVSHTELMRVLAPAGVLHQRTAAEVQRTIKPIPDDIDQWTHYLHGPDNNAVANDKQVGPPRHLQWQGGPKWTRHHDKMSTFSAMVSAGGRIYYIIDEGSIASIMFPPRWALIARDAFNGKILWRRKIDPWFSNFKGLKDGPADVPRRLIATPDRVYATLSISGPLTAMDATTGETVHTYQGTEEAEEVVLSNGTLFVLIGPGSIGDGRRMERPVEKRTILAIDEETGENHWAHADVVAATTMAVDDARLYYFNFDDQLLTGLDRTTGQKLWTSEQLPTPKAQKSFFAPKLVVADGVVLLASGEHNGMVKSGGGGTRDDTLTAVDARTGKTLWQAKHPPSGYSSPENVFVIDGVVWCDHSSNGRSDGTVVGYDLKSGKERHRFAADQKSYWFHHRCYPGRATSEYLLTSRTGIEFVNLDSEKWDLNHWVRGPCLYGIMACNGLVYAGPSPCACYAEAYLHNFNALKASGGELLPAAGNRLEKGPAYSEVGSSEAAGDWPTYRGTNARSGSTKATVPKTLTQRWATKLEGKLSSITAADGRLFVAQVDHHTVHAIDADTGKKQWHYTVGGRVDSPPTWFEGLLLFGSADGFVYCLNADTGELAWRFLAAKADRRILAFEQVESLWPVHGSILVRDGVAHFVAGRSIFVDGGMVFYRLDAKTGTIVSETILDDRNPATGKDAHELIQWLNMPVGRPDILSCDDERIYMRSQAFDLSGQRLRVGPHAHGSKEGSIQGGDETHLFCPTGFLDDTWFHRTYWLYGSTWGSGWCGYYVAGQHAPAGKMICVGDDEVFVFGRQPQYYKWTTPLEYRLFSSKKIWQKNPNPNPVTDKEKRRGGGSQPVTYQGNYNWITHVPVLVRAMVLADRTLFLAGPKDILDESKAGLMGGEPGARQEAAFLGKEGAVLWAVSADDGEKVAECQLASPPIFDGMIAADGRLYLSTIGGDVICLDAPE